MNVLLISPKYPPSQGGVETQMELLGAELLKDGHNVSVITSSEPGEPEISTRYGIDVFRYPLPKTPFDYHNGYLFIKRNLKKIKAVIEYGGIDIIHVHQFEMSVSFVHQLKKITTLPIITTVHTSLSIDKEYRKVRVNLKEPFRWLLRIRPIQKHERKSIKKSDKIIATSKELNLFCSGITDKEVITVYPSINLQQFKPGKIKKPALNEKYRILCSGRISPEKGQIVLIKALKYVREMIDAEVTFMGAGSEQDIALLKKEIKELKLDPYIQFIPPVGYAIVQDYYRDADLIVIPSLSESFGLVALENMALGNVVIASNVGGLANLIEHKKTGLLFEPGDEKGLADQINLAHSGYRLRGIIRENAIKKAYEYEIHWAAKVIEKKYAELVEGRL